MQIEVQLVGGATRRERYSWWEELHVRWHLVGGALGGAKARGGGEEVLKPVEETPSGSVVEQSVPPRASRGRQSSTCLLLQRRRGGHVTSALTPDLGIITDYVFLCPARRSARAAAAGGGAVWMYVFDHVASDCRVWSGLTFCCRHACHGAELPFLFGSAAVADFSVSAAERRLSDRTLCLWGAFAHAGDPSSRAQQTPFCRQRRPPAWPRYAAAAGWKVMNLTLGAHAQGGAGGHDCDFWDQLDIY
ncbi:Acetylcholinesterase [Liparis tanakae]|uniref:Acetylcholinesterase n=1 Tax=Liparis tanakae TaxID=230148 RepID=A0A4Z2E3M2_9TELE|nr:Acetylcholinesterase [Liparis tanakae]